jgi:hypothetical protein
LLRNGLGLEASTYDVAKVYHLFDTSADDKLQLDEFMQDPGLICAYNEMEKRRTKVDSRRRTLREKQMWWQKQVTQMESRGNTMLRTHGQEVFSHYVAVPRCEVLAMMTDTEEGRERIVSCMQQGFVGPCTANIKLQLQKLEEHQPLGKASEHRIHYTFRLTGTHTSTWVASVIEDIYHQLSPPRYSDSTFIENVVTALNSVYKELYDDSKHGCTDDAAIWREELTLLHHRSKTHLLNASKSSTGGWTNGANGTNGSGQGQGVPKGAKKLLLHASHVKLGATRKLKTFPHMCVSLSWVNGFYGGNSDVDERCEAFCMLYDQKGALQRIVHAGEEACDVDSDDDEGVQAGPNACSGKVVHTGGENSLHLLPSIPSPLSPLLYPPSSLYSTPPPLSTLPPPLSTTLPPLFIPSLSPLYPLFISSLSPLYPLFIPSLSPLFL